MSKRPKGMPRAEWKMMSSKQKAKAARFLDFNTTVTTVQENSGTQQYGAGQKLQRGLGKARTRSISLNLSNKMTNNRRNVVEQPGLSRGRHPLIAMDEFVADIDGANTFTVQKIVPIQPALAPEEGGSFPFLASIAKQYEKWRCISLEYYYVPLVSAFAAGGNEGQVILSAQYDALTPAPINTQTALTTDPHADGMPYQAITLTLDPKRVTEVAKYTRESIVANTDLKTYDGGNVCVSVLGVPSTALIGQLRVRYEFELMNPRLNLQVGLFPNNNISTFKQANLVDISGNTALVDVPGVQFIVNSTNPVLAGGAPNPLNIKTAPGGYAGSTQFILPPGQWFLQIYGNFFNTGTRINTAGITLMYSDDNGATWAETGEVIQIGGANAALSTGLELISVVSTNPSRHYSPRFVCACDVAVGTTQFRNATVTVSSA